MERRGVCENCFWDQSCVFNSGQQQTWYCQEHSDLGINGRLKKKQKVKGTATAKKKTR